jgi:hypothetical protein
VESVSSVLVFPPHHAFESSGGFAYQNIYLACTHFSSCALDLSSCVPTSLITINGSTGISTCYPSLTPFGLSLGPDLPWADEPSPGNLRLSTVKILTLLSLLIPAFSLLLRPHVLPVVLQPTTVSSPTTLVHPILSPNLFCIPVSLTTGIQFTCVWTFN